MKSCRSSVVSDGYQDRGHDRKNVIEEVCAKGVCLDPTGKRGKNGDWLTCVSICAQHVENGVFIIVTNSTQVLSTKPSNIGLNVFEIAVAACQKYIVVILK